MSNSFLSVLLLSAFPVWRLQVASFPLLLLSLAQFYRVGRKLPWEQPHQIFKNHCVLKSTCLSPYTYLALDLGKVSCRDIIFR